MQEYVHKIYDQNNYCDETKMVEKEITYIPSLTNMNFCNMRCAFKSEMVK